MKYFDMVNIAAATLLVVGIICVVQQDTPTTKKDGTRIFGGICLGLFGLIVAYKIMKTYQEIGAYQNAIKAVDAAARYEAESRYPDRDSYSSVAAERRAFMERTGRI
jgi:putative IMPACT (imprinted ancient) family translation regulator